MHSFSTHIKDTYGELLPILSAIGEFSQLPSGMITRWKCRKCNINIGVQTERYVVLIAYEHVIRHLLDNRGRSGRCRTVKFAENDSLIHGGANKIDLFAKYLITSNVERLDNDYSQYVETARNLYDDTDFLPVIRSSLATVCIFCKMAYICEPSYKIIIDHFITCHTAHDL